MKMLLTRAVAEFNMPLMRHVKQRPTPHPLTDELRRLSRHGSWWYQTLQFIAFSAMALGFAAAAAFMCCFL